LLELGGIDLAILDIRLTDDADEKDRSGLAIAREVAPLVPKIILTAYPSYKFVREILQPRADALPPAVDFVAKQDGPEAMMASVERSMNIYVQLPQDHSGREKGYAQWTEQFRQVFLGFLDKVRQAQTNDEKKKSLEYLAEFLFGAIEGLAVIDRDLRSAAEEIDCLVRNESSEPFWRNLGSPFVVECKNWGVPVGAREIRDLKGKMDSRNIRTAFLVAKHGVSGDDYRDARLELRQTLGSGKYTIVLNDSDLQEIADGDSPLGKFREKYEDLFRI
jgi:hypothetical protein